VHSYLTRNANKKVYGENTGPPPKEWFALDYSEQRALIMETCTERIFAFFMDAIGYVNEENVKQSASIQSYRYVSQAEVNHDLCGQ